MMHFGRFGYGFMGNGMGLVASILACVFFIAVMILLTVIIVKLLRSKGRGPMHFSGHDNRYYGNALEILNERYAKGEISDEEYQKKKAEIMK
ncbi:MAG: SHOCT domain-containing protein [Bacillota bacterium]|nr:SHOCT domain-containing protein [Bacillota bacterium]